MATPAAPELEQNLLQRPPINNPPPQPQDNPDDRGYNFLFSLLLFAFLTYNSLTALYKSKNDPWNATFVIAAYVDLLLLFLCLRSFEKTPVNEPKVRLKASIWLLATILTVMFSYKVAAIMPWPVALVIWLMASTTVVGGFWAFFVYKDKN